MQVLKIQFKFKAKMIFKAYIQIKSGRTQEIDISVNNKGKRLYKDQVRLNSRTQLFCKLSRLKDSIHIESDRVREKDFQ